MINIICVGKIKEQYLTDLVNDYRFRIEKYHKIKITELKEEKTLKEEARSILRNIGEKDFVYVCCIEGEKMDSIKFEESIFKAFQNAGTIDFVIGSSYGLDDVVKNRANVKLSFSDFTMPHGLFRGVLLEQIYRSFKINNNENYHK